jgi:ppGpp synthetase/RelA/SpoT-type nucleotidyltranferase
MLSHLVQYKTKEEVNWTVGVRVALMLEKDIVRAEQLLRHKSKVRSQEGSFMVPKFHVFVVKQGTTCIAQEE